MYIQATPIADIIIKIMDIALWIIIFLAIGIISLMMLTMITALTFIFFDITLDWSWMLNIF
tara:strand:+ start:909 stop:1091 length:183 start_codon:yes stop_codon:yes gene_type:complete